MKRGVAVLTALALAAVPLAACGSDDDSAEGNISDRAFLNDMIPHHAMAVDMGLDHDVPPHSIVSDILVRATPATSSRRRAGP